MEVNLKKIMIVDDSTAIRCILKTTLLGEYSVIDAENGKDAFEKAKENKIDLFLLDVNMPVMDGITLTRELRSNPSYEKTPIIILTTESREEQRKQGKEAGANGWIIKPCEPKALLNVLRTML